MSRPERRLAVGAGPSAIEQSAVTQPRSPRRVALARWLILCCYLAGAAAITWRLWADPAGRMQAGNAQDVNLFAWFLRYAATAISHRRLPALVTTALNSPKGVNMMWNTSFLLPGMLLTPVTLLAGPQVSLTVVLTLSFAGSAASMMWVLRRWGASLTGAALGGAVYGFSPAMVNSGLGHYQLVFAVLPPLMIDAVLQIVTGRGNPLRAGAWLGLLTAAQIFVGEEMLVYTAVAAAALVLVTALSYPRAVPARIRDAAVGAASAAAAGLLISGYPLWVQFRGPLREHAVLYGSWSGNPSFFVDPSGNLLFHTSSSAAAASGYYLGLPEVLTYLGWPLIAVLLATMLWFWRDFRVRAAAVTCAVLELCSLGGGPVLIGGFRLSGSFLPFHWLQGLPGMAQLLPGRFGILGAGAAGAVLAFGLDRARRATRPAWLKPAATAAAMLAIVPLIPLPYQASLVPAVPAGWQAALARLRLAPAATVLVVPVPNVGHTAPMRWQSDTSEPRSMVGGYFAAPGLGGAPVFSIGRGTFAARYLNGLWSGRARARPSSAALVRAGLAYWRPAAVIAVASGSSQLGRFLTGLLGRPAVHVGSILGWRV